MPDESVTLSVHCRRCGRPVTLAYVAGVVLHRHDWACPYDGCWMLQHVDVPGHDLTAVPLTQT